MPDPLHPARDGVVSLPQAAALAASAYQRGDWAEGERLCRLILGVQPEYFDALYLAGIIAAQTQRAQEAAALLSRAVGVNPHHADAHNNRGVVLRALGQHEAALASYERAIALEPQIAEPCNNRGNVLCDLRRYAEALRSFAWAIALEPHYAEAHSNRGIVHAALSERAAALESHEQAIAYKPDYASAYSNCGVARAEIGCRAAAIECYERAIALNPQDASVHVNLALSWLQVGDFARGWQEHEWRWQDEQHRSDRRDYAQPRWLGVEPLQGKTILLYCEQGAGDTLQFCRYVKHVAALGARVVLEVQPELLPLLAGVEGAALVLPRGAPLPAFDCHCALLSLPLAFRTELNDIPGGVPYLYSDAARVALWQGKLGQKTRPRIGLAWSGNPLHKNDRNRSIALSELLPLISERFEWVSLQQEVRAADAAVLAAHSEVRHFGGQLKDYADTAALVELMDVVVTVDTSVAHLAGAMGKTVWILLPFNSDWRWLLGRADSVWYPAARLYRQPAFGDWASVIQRVCVELEQKLAPFAPEGGLGLRG